MNNNYVEIKELTQVVNTGLDAIKRAPIVEENTGYKCLRIQDISQNKPYNEWGNTKVNEKDFERFQLAKDDILIARTGASIGVLKIISKDYNAVYNNGLIRIKSDLEKVNPKYLYYNLKSQRYISHIYGISAGTSTQPNMRINDLLRFKIRNTNLEEQKEIADVLSLFDKKIEVNNKISDFLEKLTQSLYKHWFVDYEFPNEEGNPYKSNGGKMVEDEEGYLPVGWEIILLDDHLNFLRGIEPGSKNYQETETEENIPFYRVGDMIDNNKVKYIQPELANDRLFNEKDVLVSFDGAIGRIMTGNKGAYSTGMRKVFSKNNIFSNEYIYVLFQTPNIQNTIEQYANGTTILHASSSIKHLKTVYNKEIVEKFNSIIEPMINKIRSVKKENNELAEMRDLLLPKLMSGELKVPFEED